MNKAKEIAHKKLELYSDKIIWIEKYSNDAVVDIPSNLDFVYIDGNHQEEYVYIDIANYIKKIQDGVIGGHDFYNGFQRDHDGVIKAVTKYSFENNLELQVELPDWWFIYMNIDKR